jgi:uncharacterized protein (TIGR03083 family)
MPINEDAALIAERTSMYEMLQTLSEEEWNRDSLCEGWRVRDVATHAHLLVTIKPLRAVVGVVLNRGNINKFMASYVPQLGNRPTEEILASWAEVATSAKIPPTTKKVEITLDCFVHRHDICVPLGREVSTDPERLRWMADGMVAAKNPILSGPRVEGLQLIATDIDWHYGTGPEIKGPAAALILAGCGRTALHDQLEGSGLDELRRRS